MPKLAPGLSLWALNNYLEEDGGVFKNVTLTDKLNLTTCIDTIIEKWGTCDLIISDPRIVVRRTQLFFLKNYDNFDKMAEAILAEYNPIENYDRYEDTSEDRNIGKSGTNENTSNSSGHQNTVDAGSVSNNIGGNDTEHRVSAMNENTYQPSSKDINSGQNNLTSSSNSVSSDDTINSSGDTLYSEATQDGLIRDSHIHGNIGVTSSQQMITQSIELYKFNIYDYIADLYASEFLYRIW